jgi:hypothetical protein
VRRAPLLLPLLALLALAPAAPAAEPTCAQGDRPGKATTRPVGSPALSDRDAARRVCRSAWEPRPDNADENRRVPTRAELRRFRHRSEMPYKDRVTGRFRGTTDEII